jgi:hypothetical protein
MTGHAKDALRGPRIAQVLDLAFAVPAAETTGAESLIAGQDGEIFDLVATGAAAVCAIVAYE